MEKIGLFVEMGKGVSDLAEGRRKLYVKGTEIEGLLQYREGYEVIMSLFKEALASGDPEIMLLAEFFYTASELHESYGNEPVAKSSAQAAVRKFEEALWAVRTVQDPHYGIVHKVFSSERTYRHKGMPKDAYHIACLSDRARVKNGLSRMGLSAEDKGIAFSRVAMLDGAQDAYMGLQNKSLPVAAPER
jgi:hypothetical protein